MSYDGRHKEEFHAAYRAALKQELQRNPFDGDGAFRVATEAGWRAAEAAYAASADKMTIAEAREILAALEKELD